jgi:hypothetical protein
MTDVDPHIAAHWDHALTWNAWLESVEDKRDLWLANAKRAAVQPAEQARLEALPGPRRVLILTEDWCGDAIRSVPVMARACEDTEGLEARYLPLDAYPDAIEGLRTHGGQAIPMAVVADAGGRRLGVWGPRPAPLQALLRAQQRELGPPTAETKGTWYQPIMAWYGADRGVTTLQELLMLLERGGEAR